MDNSIKRQDAIDAVRRLQTYKLFEGGDMLLVDKAEVQTELMMLPSAQKHGHWIKIRDEEDGNTLYECSECHKGECHCRIVEVSYCWNCGARMDGDAVDS